MLHSRVARSNILAFRAMGAEVTVCGPPTLIPRGIEALGCAVSYSLDGLGEADVVYVLRMQSERMSGELRPLDARVRDPLPDQRRRLGASQLLMHPGPVNRGVELSADVVDSPQSLITEQVAAGVVVRMAVLYELLAGRGDGGRPGASARRRSRPVDDDAPNSARPAGVSARATALDVRRLGRGRHADL